MSRFPTVGDDFGAYRITGQLGRGGMGVVFAAEQRGLGRTVALKVLSPELAEQPDYRERFAREATVLASLDSPHIIAIFDHGEQDGCLYIATQYVPGGDLSEGLRRHGPVPTSQAAQITGQLAWALSDAHAAGIVHRDLKPSNVLLRDTSSEIFAYLCDFGIAQNRTPGLTAPGSVAGTFAYLAPERLRGEPATPSADVYALGCVLWTSLTGATPYAGTDVEIGMSHLNDPVPQLAETSPVAAAANQVLRHALAKHPSQRYPAASVMRADLQRLAQLAQATPHRPLAAPATPATVVRLDRSGPSQPSQPSHPSRPAATPLGPPPPRPGHAYPTARPARSRRTAVLVAAAVATVVVATGAVAAVATRGGSGENPKADPTRSSSTEDPTTPTETTPTTTPSSPPSSPPSTPSTPTTPSTPDPQPFYPDVAAATGAPLSLGRANLRTPSGWGGIDKGVLQAGGVGARDYNDYEGYYSSVFVRRSEPAFPLTSVDLLDIVAESSAKGLAEQNAELDLVKSNRLRPAWLDGQRAARIRAVYHNTDDDLYFSEESWFAQKGRFLYRVTFQHSRIDSAEERRSDIDPMIVSFRWSSIP